MTEGLFVNLTATGSNPMYSRICTLLTVGLYAGSDFAVHEKSIGNLEDERLALTALCDALAVRTLVYNNESAVKYLSECCRQYSLAFTPTDIIPLYECLDELKGMGMDMGACMGDVPHYEGELKHFYKDYKNYYYLPAEDQAYHKSVSSFVDKSARIQATARTAYTKKTGTFIPVYDVSCIDPGVLFQKEYGHEAFYTLPQYLDLNNLKAAASYMWRPHKHPDA